MNNILYVMLNININFQIIYHSNSIKHIVNYNINEIYNYGVTFSLVIKEESTHIFQQIHIGKLENYSYQL